MSVSELLAQMNRLGVEFRIDNGRLRFTAPEGVMTRDLRDELHAHKAEIIEFLTDARDAVASKSQPIGPASRDGELALSFAQQRLWFMNQLVPDSAFGNIPAVPRLQGPLDRAALQWSFDQLVIRHEALRTSFKSKAGRPIQVIGSPKPVDVPLIDLTDLPLEQREAEARRLAALEAQRIFDVSRGPLFRTRLLRLAEEDHVLVLTMHHIVSDGWSMGVLMRELAELYTARCSRRAPTLAELPIQYADFAAWQRDWLQGDLLDSQLHYWKRQLTDLSTLQLPLDHPRPALQSHRGTRQRLTLPSTLSDRLKELGTREGTTLFMTLLAAFSTLLHRYTRQDDVVVGSPIANRNRAELEGLIGCFVNSLVMRTDASGNPTFRELLARVRNMAMSAYAHQDLPFEKLVEELDPDRDLSHNPLFQVVFALQNASISSVQLGDVLLTLGWADTLATRFDLEVHAWDDPDGLKVVFIYNTDLFETSTIRRMLDHYRVLLEGIASDPERRLAQLPLMTEAERRQVLVQFNQTTAPYRKEATVHRLFEQQVQRSPDSVALLFEGQRLTYAQLNARANQLAHYLMKHGVGRETMVGICMPRSIEMVVGILGILKAGGAYVPLDTSYPKERVAAMIEDAGLNVLVALQSLTDKLPSHGAKVVCLDADRERIADQSQANPAGGATAESLAYVMYTSGSTGRPKGVAVPHRAVVRLLVGVDYVHLDSRETLLQMAPTSFDASTFEIWGALVHGAKCVLFTERVPGTRELGQVIAHHGITTLWLTSSLFNFVIDEAPEILSGVKQLLTGGEALSVPHVRRALDELPATQIINGYGPTEGTTFTCCHPIPRPLEDNLASIPIGRPIANTQVYILDRRLQPVPVGMPGELCIGGDGLARGYINDAELTAKRFIPNPFDGEPDARLYRTGDRARYLDDGTIEFLGRFDYQVKLRGFRIELGEIETILGTHPAVREVVAILREDIPGEKYLAAYVVASEEDGSLVARLRDFLKQTLPTYMVPATFTLVDALPLTPNGKVDHRALPVPERGRQSSEQSFVAPRTEVERAVSGVWQDVLAIEKIGLHDNFFDIGGNSLLLVQVQNRIREAVGRDVSVVDLFRYPTVEALARHLSREDGEGGLSQQDGDWQGKLREGRNRLAHLRRRRDSVGQREQRD